MFSVFTANGLHYNLPDEFYFVLQLSVSTLNFREDPAELYNF